MFPYNTAKNQGVGCCPNVGLLLHLVPLIENVEAVADHWWDATATVAQVILVGLKLPQTLAFRDRCEIQY